VGGSFKQSVTQVEALSLFITDPRLTLIQIVAREKATLKDQDPRDVISWLLRAEEGNDRSAPPGEGAFQEDARLMIIAGR
jgi:hypothetical protein